MKDNILSLSIVDKIIGAAPYMCEGDFSDRIRYAKELGYGGVELNIANPANLDLPAIRAAVKETGVRIVAFGTGRAYVNEGVSLTDPDADCRAAADARLRTFLDIAGEFGSLVILGCIRGNIRTKDEEPEVLKRLGDAMNNLEQYASDRETAMILEPINRYENNFLCNVEDTSKFIHDAGLVRTKILMDTFHMNIEEPNLVRSIETYGDDVAYVHIADSNRKFPGLGHTDFSAVLSALAKKNYTGPLCAECHANGNLDEGCRAWISSVNDLLKNI